MSFKFNFNSSGGEDSDAEDNNAASPHAQPDSSSESLPAQSHTLESLLSTLPRNISYSYIATDPPLPRRELYDVRMQLMAEDDLSSSSARQVLVLGAEDIRTRVYEGGLKSWECSLDLAIFLGEEEMDVGGKLVLELGCGTAIPSLFLFRKLLRAGKNGKLVLADYNIDVLRLVTVPNLLLVWAAATKPELLSPEAAGDLDASEELRCEFLKDLESRGIQIELVSGSWGQGMLEIVGREAFDIVMGSETIYSPATTPDFTAVLLQSLKRGGRGLVAAKRIYFGVGGSVEDFVREVEKLGWSTKTARDMVEVGVGRVIVEVASNDTS
jgi:protein-histidine N-methyltransferase